MSVTKSAGSASHRFHRLGCYQREIARHLSNTPMPIEVVKARLAAVSCRYGDVLIQRSLQSLFEKRVAAQRPGGIVRGQNWDFVARKYEWLSRTKRHGAPKTRRQRRRSTTRNKP